MHEKRKPKAETVQEEALLGAGFFLRSLPDFSRDRDLPAIGSPGNLAIAQSVTLDLPVGASRDVTTVSKDGVIQRPTGAMVFLVRDKAAQPQPVRLGAAVDSRFEVLDGLSEGDLVVVRGNERLRPGQAVTYPGAPAAENMPSDADGKDEG